MLERILLPGLSPSALAFDPNAVKVRTVAADKQAPGGQLHVACSRLSQIAVLFFCLFFFPLPLSRFHLVLWLHRPLLLGKLLSYENSPAILLFPRPNKRCNSCFSESEFQMTPGGVGPRGEGGVGWVGCVDESPSSVTSYCDLRLPPPSSSPSSDGCELTQSRWTGHEVVEAGS